MSDPAAQPEAAGLPGAAPGDGHRTRVAWSEELLAYNFGPGHPMNPARLDLTARLCRDLGLFGHPAVHVAAPHVADDAELGTVHTPEYIAAVRRASEDPARADPLRGLGTEDDPAFAGMHEAAARIAGASLEGAEAILDGSALHAVNFAGGLHHAAADRASGFCIYNDAAAAIRRLLDGGAARVAYIDIDAHHGDGTQAIFWDEPRVLTISLHESGLSLFPGTGFANETGGPGAPGTAVNVALPAGTRDAGWLRAFHATVPSLVEAFRPEVIVSQHGCDAHGLDPLTNLAVSVDAQRAAALTIASLARRFCEGRWLATGGGGYEVVEVVPRAWAHVVGIAVGRPVQLGAPTPPEWRDYVRERYGRTAPAAMGEGGDLWWRSWDIGVNPNDALDRSVMATRKEVFPLHGLDPWFD